MTPARGIGAINSFGIKSRRHHEERDIMLKFRQRNTQDGSWHIWGFVDGVWVQPLTGAGRSQDVYAPPEASDQCTGAKDKHGAEIYEGDSWRGVTGTLYSIVHSERAWRAMGADSRIGWPLAHVCTENGEVVGLAVKHVDTENTRAQCTGKENYIVSSGAGYFTEFIPHGSPEMATDPVVATRMELDEAQRVITMMNQSGFVAELVRLKLGNA